MARGEYLRNYKQEEYENSRIANREIAAGLLSSLDSDMQAELDRELNLRGSGINFILNFPKPAQLEQSLQNWQRAFEAKDKSKMTEAIDQLVQKLE